VGSNIVSESDGDRWIRQHIGMRSGGGTTPMSDVTGLTSALNAKAGKPPADKSDLSFGYWSDRKISKLRILLAIWRAIVYLLPWVLVIGGIFATNHALDADPFVVTDFYSGAFTTFIGFSLVVINEMYDRRNR
jgi:hypothetical protein